MGKIGGRPLSAEAVLEHGQRAPGEPVTVLGERDLETAAFAKLRSSPWVTVTRLERNAPMASAIRSSARSLHPG
jgi:hypothetical protein